MHIEIQNCFSFWGTSSPRPPTGASPLDPTGGLPSPRPPAQDVPHILYQVYAPYYGSRDWISTNPAARFLYSTAHNTIDKRTVDWPQIGCLCLSYLCTEIVAAQSKDFRFRSATTNLKQYRQRAAAMRWLLHPVYGASNLPTSPRTVFVCLRHRADELRRYFCAEQTPLTPGMYHD